jgi:hypothetical protein
MFWMACNGNAPLAGDTLAADYLLLAALGSVSSARIWFVCCVFVEDLLCF